MKHDRRATRRLHPRNALQLIFDCGGPVIGRIRDISEAGASVQYEGRCQPDLHREMIISIVGDGSPGDMIEDLRCIPVYNIPTLAEGRSFRGTDIRMLGLAFDALSPSLARRLGGLLAGLA